MRRGRPGVFPMRRFIGRFSGQLILALSALIVLFPFLWMFFASFKAEKDVISDHFSLLPSQWMFSNYVEAWNAAPFGDFFINSLSVAAITVVSQVVTCSLAAYAFAKLEFKFKTALFTILMASMMIPEEAAIIPNYLLAQRFGLINTYFGLSMTTLTSVFGIFLLRQVFMTIPDDLLNAAKLDGCGELRTFFYVVLPNASSSIATLALLAFLTSWNSYMWPYMVTDENTSRTIQIGLKYMIQPDLGPQWPMIMAASTMIVLPVLVLFLCLQRFFVDGMVKSGIK